MKTYIKRIIFENRAPFDKLDLSINENEIAILTSFNGSGKTTLLSHIVDAWHEMARPHFPNEYEEKANKLYRISSAIYNLDTSKPSLVYIQFNIGDLCIDYVDIRNICSEEQYNQLIKIDGEIPFNQIKPELDENSYVKKISDNFNKKIADKIFSDNLITYFPSYRYEAPGYLNAPYKVNLDFRKQSAFSGYLKNPLEVITGLPQLANWIMDIVLDMRMNPVMPDLIVFNNLNTIITQTLMSKKLGDLRFGIGPRGFGGSRIQIVNVNDSQSVYPTIFNLLSGESSMLCLFGELLRQADNCRNNIQLSPVTGIVLIDEVDKHLHIKLQKEVLPKLFRLFPNVQFIVSSHSPFLSMGLAETIKNRTKIVDLCNMGISTDPTSNELYAEVYNMMISENEKFKEMFLSLNQATQTNNIPLIVTEGKTDIQHIKKAKEALGIQNCEIEFFDIAEDWGDTKLKLLLEQISKVRQNRKIIGIFDRDTPAIVADVEKNGQLFKDYSNNVFGFCIPVPAGRESYANISIEFYYSDYEIKKIKNNRSLFFDNEVDYLFNKSTNKPEVRRLANPRTEKDTSKKIFDEAKICEVADWVHSKSSFAGLIETDTEFTDGFDFSNFNLIFNRIKIILYQT